MDLSVYPLEGTPYRVPDCTLMTDKAQVVPGTRIFYEMGGYQHYSQEQGWTNYQRYGKFREIELTPDEFRTDEYLDDPAYLVHHNFYIKLPAYVTSPPASS